MTAFDWLQIIIFFTALIALVKPLGAYMANVYEGKITFLRPVENAFYRLAGIDLACQMDWKAYALAVLLFNAIGFLFLYALLRLQAWLPLNPQGLGVVPSALAFNTAASFTSNTNWQAYGGETAMSYLSQMLGLGVQNFLSAATGMAVLAALIRGITSVTRKGIGNFYVDLTRSTFYILLPLAMILALALVSQGTVQTFAASRQTDWLQPSADSANQTVALGPAASQIAIKQLGTNGGGFFNVNAAHPFENPTPLSNFLEMLAILLIPAALTYTYGQMVGDTRQGWAIFIAMTVIFALVLSLGLWAEFQGNPNLSVLGVDPSAGNMEGKEVRFGVANSVLWSVATTAASNGSVNSMHDSYTPLGGLVPMWLIQLGKSSMAALAPGCTGCWLSSSWPSSSPG